MWNVLGLFVCMLVWAAAPVRGQKAETLRDVHRVYLRMPANKPALADLTKELSREIRKSGTVTLVDDPSQADAVLAADGDIFIKGYLSLNPRAGSSPGRGEPLRGGFLSLELKGKGNETLWSYLATPRAGSTHLERDLSRQVTRELVGAIRGK